MDRVVVLRKTCEKHFSETETIIDELKLKILCIFVPYKRKLKRKDEDKLRKLISKHEKIFTDEQELCHFQSEDAYKSGIECFLQESIGYLIKNDCTEKIAVECNENSNLLLKTVLELSEKYRSVDLYTFDSGNAFDVVRELYASVGLPVRIKNADEITNCKAGYIVRVGNSISVYNTAEDKEYTDIITEFLYPLNKYSDLPLMKILKSGAGSGKYRDIIKKGMVKIVGVISK